MTEAAPPVSARVKQNSKSIPGPVGALETSVDFVNETACFKAVVCHPHPLHQGTMDNKVVTTLSRTLARSGGHVARFNFRGVGQSAGRYDGFEGEMEDTIAVIKWLRESYQDELPLVLGGFSFGGAIAYGASEHAKPGALITVAPAFDRIPQKITPPQCRWLLVQGSADEVIPTDGVLQWQGQHANSPNLVLLEEAGHFFHGKLGQLSDAVADFISESTEH